MTKIFIVADDLTGANAAGALLAKKGIRSATFLNLDAYSVNSHSAFEAIAINTDSRAVLPFEAFARVKNVIASFQKQGIRLFAKRIDSTLRGNIGAEIDGALEALGEGTLAVVVPAFPSSGRTTVEGQLLVDNKPLAQSAVAMDAKTPVLESDVGKIIKQQSRHKIVNIPLSVVQSGQEHVNRAILNSNEHGVRIIIFDAKTDEDIAVIAEGVTEVPTKILAVDPGPFTAALGSKLLKESMTNQAPKVFMVIGSVSPLTRTQLQEVQAAYNVELISVHAGRLFLPDTAAAEIERVVAAVRKQVAKSDVIGIHTMPESGHVLDLKALSADLGVSKEELSERIVNGLGQIAYNVLAQDGCSFKGLYTSGGDITLGVCKALQVQGLAVLEEVLPLAVYCKLIGGRWNGFPVITKGGLIGESWALRKCLEYLFAKAVNTDEMPNKSIKQFGEGVEDVG